MMRKTIGKISVVFIVSILSLQAIAHSRWIVPSHTIFSGEMAEYVSLDFSISNDIFHPDLPLGGEVLVKPDSPNANIMSMASMRVMYPDGSIKKNNAIVNLGRKSVSALQLTQSGTYRFDVEQAPVLITTFTNSDGSSGRRFGGLRAVMNSLPEGVRDVATMQVHNTVATFVTRNQLSEGVLAPSNKGLEVRFTTHPNENFVGEKSQYQLLLDGEPVTEALALRLTRGGTRFRNQRHVIEPQLDAEGNFFVDWPQGGYYLLEIEVERESQEDDISVDVYAYYLTLEANPE